MEPLRITAPASQLLDHLFPFHFILDRELVVTEVGSSLERWIGKQLVGHPLPDGFAVDRPANVGWDYDQVADQSEAVFLIHTSDKGRRLRGQMLLLENHQLLFVGSPVVHSSDTLRDLGLSLRDFPPHDATADIVVLAQVSALQIRDIERKARQLSEALEERDEYSVQARTDALTGLLNRNGFWEYWEKSINVDFDNRIKPLLVYLDMDKFKSVNDDFGHVVGDELLQAVGRRLSDAMRTDDVAVRLGGDEFAFVLNNVAPSDREVAVERVVSAVTKEVQTSNGLVPVSVSVGVTVVQSAHSVSQILRDADTAMYEGRATSRGQITWFSKTMGLERERERLLVSDLRTVLNRGEIDVAYQPIVQLSDQRLIAFEALARWRHPYLGRIQPSVFIELAERAGFVQQLDLAVMSKALRALHEWRTKCPDLVVNVNLSGLSITDDLPKKVSEMLRQVDESSESLRIEVTESRSINSDQIRVLEKLIKFGVRLSLDDFGTGFSSMSHIQSMPVCGLKIDRSFIANLGSSDKDRRLVAATVSMAASLGLTVVAEGIEDRATESELIGLACPLGQGFLYSKPLNETDASDFIVDWNSRATTPSL